MVLFVPVIYVNIFTESKNKGAWEKLQQNRKVPDADFCLPFVNPLPS